MTMRGVELAVRCDGCGGTAARRVRQFVQERGRRQGQGPRWELWWDSEESCRHCGAACCEHAGPEPTPEAVREVLPTAHGPFRLRPAGASVDAVAALRAFRAFRAFRASPVLQEGDAAVSLGRARELLGEFRDFGLVGTEVEMTVLGLLLRDHGVPAEVSTGRGRAYRYVGPPELWGGGGPGGQPVRTGREFAAWVGERTAAELAEPFTFVVDLSGFLRLVPRRSEHVVCAGGESVLSAGEVRFEPGDGADFGGWTAEEVSNQSTGYCPDVVSWPAVAAALERIGVRRPGGFTYGVVFRRCPGCRGINVVREGCFVCVFCDGDLPARWNVDDGSRVWRGPGAGVSATAVRVGVVRGRTGRVVGSWGTGW
ncbi:hypothetical protein AB0C76_23025 [Kitasatospora sp. NPDC048722]|uniref:hypothetical protein n=1 Tax=Kitasatospora sp. NPDC048722 TaxID=3155639 RepID=UPI0033D551CE